MNASYPSGARCGPLHLHSHSMGFVVQKTSSGSHLQIRDGGVSREAVVFSVEKKSHRNLKRSQKTFKTDMENTRAAQILFLKGNRLGFFVLFLTFLTL